MAFIRMNCYAYGLPFEPPPALEMVSTFRLGETNSFRNSLKEIVSLFFFRFFPSSDAASLSFLLCERLHSPLTSSSTHSAPRGCFVSFLVWLARKSELSQQVEVKTGSSKKTRNLRTGALRPPNAFFHATFTLGQSGGNINHTTVIIKGTLEKG